MTIPQRFSIPSKFVFIALNMSISGLGFFRSIIFLKFMGFYELGLLSVFQTLILLIGLSQVGILNGAYRAFSGSQKYYRKAINNFTFTFFLLLTIVSLTIVVTYFIFDFSDKALIALLGSLAGIFSLMTNYLTNTLLSDSRIREINIINVVSNVLGFSSLALILYHPLLGILSFIIQPFFFVLMSLIVDRSLIPQKVHFSFSIFHFLLRLGFIPYLTSLFVYLNLQIERWTIVFFLGIEAFGHFYLAVAYAALFALFPNSVNSLYFPRMVRANSENKSEEFNRLLKQYSYILLIYCGLAAVATFWLSPWIIGIFFPAHLENLRYVFYILPGLTFITLAGPFIVYFNASLNLKPLLIAYASSTIVIAIIMLILYIGEIINLKTIAVADSIGNSIIAVLAIFTFFKVRADRAKNQAALV